MKISKTLEKIINEQIGHELSSAYDYLGIAAWFETTPFKGFAHWMRKQSKEELSHAMKFYEYLIDREGVVELMSIDKPKMTYGSVIDAFKATLKHEQKITKSIHEIYEAATKEKDFETIDFLGWFLKEQIEEEKSIINFLEKLEISKESTNALFILDSLAAKRE